MNILNFHIKMLIILVLWPIPSLNKAVAKCIMYSFCSFNILVSVPVLLTFYQVILGRYDIDIFLETLISLFDFFGYVTTYLLFLNKREEIKKAIKDINIFRNYCGQNVISDIDAVCTRFTKYLIIYVTIGLIVNLGWPLTTKKKCKLERGSEFVLKHDPCGMASHNYYPFDASQPVMFWIVFTLEGLTICHICFVFSMSTATILGLLMHIRAQLRHCGIKFKNINYNNDARELKKEFDFCIRYHQEILSYIKNTFSVCYPFVSVHLTVTSFATAVIGLQIVSSETIQDKVRYTMLLFAWSLLFFLVCFFTQAIQDESINLGASVYNSNWDLKPLNKNFAKNIGIVLCRAQKPLDFDIPWLGKISLSRYLSAMKTGYSFFTLLLTVTDRK